MTFGHDYFYLYDMRGKPNIFAFWDTTQKFNSIRNPYPIEYNTEWQRKVFCYLVIYT